MVTESEPISPTFYIAVVVIESSLNSPDYKPLYEERFLLIQASSEEEARGKAIQRSSEPLAYKNVYGETVTWSFKKVVDVKQVWEHEIVDGTEIFSRFFRRYEAYYSVFQDNSDEDDE